MVKEHSFKTGIPALLFLTAVAGFAQQPESEKEYVRSHYAKFEYRIPMRDGVKLFTAVYVPNDRTQKYPILLLRTPYNVGPYGADQYKGSLGPNIRFATNGYIFAYQDVRGRFMSEGAFSNMTPHVPEKKSQQDIDESTDTYDTIEWLIKNIENHNGNVGQWGISYPGFYAAAGMIDTHPALKAVSPQAPIADWFWDDFHHNGALFLPHMFNFFANFGKPRPKPTTEGNKAFDYRTPDGYQFFLELGPLKNADEKHLKSEISFWNETIEHPNYDSFWQRRNLLPHLRNIRCAVMTVGGWFDAENLFGPLKIHRTIERNNPGIFNVLVMGPWAHGDWGRGAGEALGNARFGFKTGEFYREQIEFPFFEHHLKGKGNARLPEAYVFETGANRWRTFDHWPPRTLEEKTLYLGKEGRLSFEPPQDPGEAFDEYISDPAKPVPFTDDTAIGMTREYMTDDQRFASRRPDVLVYQTDVLENDLTLAGPIQVDLWVSTSGSDADWIVKVIDVLPGTAPDNDPNPRKVRMGGYQMMVRSEVMRGRFRNSFEHPEPFEPNKATKVSCELLDLLHTFKRNHRLMVQIQSTWFPLVDRNPQKFVPNIYKADESDFIKATQRVFRSRERAGGLKIGVLKPADM
ncbi:MAG: CocE/NonD family hydrolase [Verrucomicrobia bacterium]|nr:CocE/NonD family hydrolase [Verrucomicrobiota bacterium]